MMDRALIKELKARVDISCITDLDNYEEMLKLGIKCGLVQAYAEGGGTVEVLWSNDALIYYLEMEVPEIIAKRIIQEMPVIEKSKSKPSSEELDIVHGVEQK